MASTVLNVQSDELGLTHSFRELALEMVRLGEQVPVQIIPFRDSALPYFSSLSAAHKGRIIASLKNAIEICHETIASGNNLGDSRALIWNALKKFQMTPPSDLFSKITQDDVVEIFDLENIQIFRNFRYFEFCSYTLEDIFCRPWNELFIREDNSVGEKLVQAAIQLLTNPVRETVSVSVGTHKVREAQSLFQNTLAVEVKFLSCLFSGSPQPVAYMAIESAELVSTLSDDERNRRMEDLVSGGKGREISLVR